MKKIALIVLGVVLGFVVPVWAARNPGGTFTWTAPGGEVASSGNPISSTWANTTLAEARQALTDSLSRSGQGGMLAPLKVCSTATGTSPDCGLPTSPGLYFDGATTTGLYLDGTTLSAAVGTSNILDLTSTDALVNGSLTVTGAVKANNSLIVEDPGASTNSVIIQSPTLAADIGVTLPAALPASNSIVKMTTGGQLGYVRDTRPTWNSYTWVSGICNGQTLYWTNFYETVYIRAQITVGSGGSCTYTLAAGNRPSAATLGISDFINGNTMSVSSGGVITLSFSAGGTSFFYAVYPVDQ